MNEVPNQGVANSSKTPYSRSGDDYYMVEPLEQAEQVPSQNQEKERPMNAQEAADRLKRVAEETARRRERESKAREENAEKDRKAPEQGSTSQSEEKQGTCQERGFSVRFKERLEEIEQEAPPELKGISQTISESLDSGDLSRLQQAHRNVLRQYQIAESNLTNEYSIRHREGRYTGPEDPKLADDIKEYQKKMENLKKIRDKIVGIFGETLITRSSLSPEEQVAVDAIKGLKERIKDKDVSEKMKEAFRKELRESALKIVEKLDPENQAIDDEILMAIGADDVASERFLTRIVILPSEDHHYQLHGLYTAVNLNRFLSVNKNLIGEERYERLENLARGTETIHEMNRILKTSIEQFAQVSQTILSSHLSTLFRTRGVQDVFELYEGIVKENLSIETMITDNVFKEIDKQVEDYFKERVSKKVTSLKGEGGLEEWERDRAFIYGRNLYRTLMREVEYIGFSELPEGMASFISLAQGQLMNIFNPVQYSLVRFEIGQGNGGVELIEDTLDEDAAKRRTGRNKEESKGIVRLKTVMGTSVRNREATKIVGTRGAIMTWRATEAILREFPIIDKGRVSNIAQFFGDHAGEINTLNEISTSNAWESEFKRTGNNYVDKKQGEDVKDWEKRKKGQLDAWKIARVESVFGELFKNNASALGVLVSPVAVDSLISTEVREILWRKISDLNPDVMASILTRLEVDKDAVGSKEISSVKSLEQILLESFGTEDQRKLLQVNGVWHPGEAKKTYDRLDKEWKILQGRLARAQTEQEKSALRGAIDKKTKERDAAKAHFKALDAEVKLLLRNGKWTALRGKLRTINRLRMLDETERMMKIRAIKPGQTLPDPKELSPKEFKDYLNHPDLEEDDRISPSELAVINAISANGKKIAQDLANIKQATVWFLDDVPTNMSKWENLGQFFNRVNGDLGQYNQGATEFIQFTENPYSAPMEQVLDHQEKIVKAKAQVTGYESAQDDIKGVIMTYNKATMTYPRYRQKIIDMIASAGHKFTSPAQELTRDTGAPSHDEDAMYTVLLTQNNKHIFRGEKRDKYGRIQIPDSFKEAVKALKVGTLHRVLWANLRDWGPFFFLGMLLQFFKETTADEKR